MEMFGFLRSSKKAAPPQRTVRRIGVDWGVDTVFAVLLDEHGHPLDLRNIAAPPEDPEKHFEGLEGLLADWPLADSTVVVSLTRDYQIAAVELPEPNRAAVADKLASQLEYAVDEASFAWRKLDGNRVIAVAYPTSLLHELGSLFSSIGAQSVSFEPVELAQMRLLETFGLPAGSLTVHADLMQMTMASASDFETITQSTALIGVEQMVSLGLERWKGRGQPTPARLLTNLSPDHLARLSGLDCDRLEEEAVAFHLALSPEGTHRFSAPAPAQAT